MSEKTETETIVLVGGERIAVEVPEDRESPQEAFETADEYLGALGWEIDPESVDDPAEVVTDLRERD